MYTYRLYGDLIIWKSVLSKVKTEKKDVVFVTNDMKEDCWVKIGGKHYPRVELLREFIHGTSQKIKIYSFKGFLDSVCISKTTEGKKAMKEINSLSDEYYKSILNNINIGTINMDDIRTSVIQDEFPKGTLKAVHSPTPKDFGDDLEGILNTSTSYLENFNYISTNYDSNNRQNTMLWM